jgi:hypothetical protein
MTSNHAPPVNGERTMAYGHAERNLALLRQLEAETLQLLKSVDQPDLEQSTYLQEVTNRGVTSVLLPAIEPAPDGGA